MSMDLKQFEYDLSGIAQGFDDFLENKFERRLGFAILVFEFDKPSIGHYVSNAERKSMIEALRETANRLEAKEDIGPAIGKA